MSKVTEKYQNDIQNRLSHLLKTVKRKKGWTNKDLADALDVSVSLMEKWCSKNVSSFVKNDLVMVSKLADISGYSTSSLVTMLEDPDCTIDFLSKNLTATTKAFQEMVNGILKLDEKECDMLNTMVTFYTRLDLSQRNAIKITLDTLFIDKKTSK